MLDGICQTESTVSGPAVVDGSMDDVQLSKLTTDVLNDGNRLRRTMVLISDDDGTKDYPIILDINEAIIANQSEVSNHFFDLITHSESTQYSLTDSNGGNVNTAKVTQSMGSDVAWQYLKTLKKTESKEAMKGVWEWGHTVRQQFDRSDEWSASTTMELTKDHVKCGQYSMRWKDHVKAKSLSAKKYMTDWSEVDHITLTLYNAVNNTEKLYLIVYSENATNPSIDYYYLTMPLTWLGWKTFNWTKSNFYISRKPMGWNAITGMEFSSAWGHTEQSSSDLYFDSMKFFRADGSEIDGLNGLEHYLPQVNHERKTFFDLNAPSIPTSKSHAVSIIRQNAIDPVVQILKPYTENQFISSFTKNGNSYVINTNVETITVDPGDLNSDAPCSIVKRESNTKGTVTTYLACSSISLSESKSGLSVSIFSKEDSFVSFQTANTPPEYDEKSDTVVFKNVKVTGNKNIGITVKSCSSVPGFTVSINGKTAEVISKEYTDKGQCVSMTFSTIVDQSEMGDITVLLKDLTLSRASHIQRSMIVFVSLFLFYLFM